MNSHRRSFAFLVVYHRLFSNPSILTILVDVVCDDANRVRAKDCVAQHENEFQTKT